MKPASKPVSWSDLRRVNRSLILRRLLRDGPLSRSELVERTRLTSGAVSRITSEMIDAGLVTEGEPHAPKGKPGRRFVALDVAGDGFHVLGLGLEASSQELALADLRGNIIAKRSIGVRRLGDPVAVAVAEAGGEVAETKRNGPVGGPS